VDNRSNTLRDISARQEVMVPGAWPTDPAMDAYLKKVRERSDAALARPVAMLALPSVDREKTDDGESALGDMVADAFLAAGRPFGAQLSFVNNGSMRQDLGTVGNNRVTLGKVLFTLPFGNTMVVMNLRGSQIYALLEEQWNGGRDITRGLLQVSDGFTYAWDPKRPVGSKVVPGSVLLNGAPLALDRSYRVVVNNFLAEGGDAFPTFARGGERAETGIRDIDALAGYLVQREQAGTPAGRATPQNRIKRLP
jgi:5'-nucleotidase